MRKRGRETIYSEALIGVWLDFALIAMLGFAWLDGCRDAKFGSAWFGSVLCLGSLLGSNWCFSRCLGWLDAGFTLVSNVGLATLAFSAFLVLFSLLLFSHRLNFCLSVTVSFFTFFLFSLLFSCDAVQCGRVGCEIDAVV